MKTFVVITLVVLIVSSFFTALLSRKRKEESIWASLVFSADLIFGLAGLILVALANAATLNQFAKYEEGFPNVDMGGLPAVVLIGNLLIFCTPLIAWGLARAISHKSRSKPRTLMF